MLRQGFIRVPEFNSLLAEIPTVTPGTSWSFFITAAGVPANKGNPGGLAGPGLLDRQVPAEYSRTKSREYSPLKGP